jgi:hypothetical protein
MINYNGTPYLTLNSAIQANSDGKTSGGGGGGGGGTSTTVSNATVTNPGTTETNN